MMSNPSVETTLQYALQRGIEQEYQLEESELSSERIGSGEYRAILFSESGEGGSGVLRRLIDAPDALSRIAEQALTRCHFDADGNDTKPDCHASCYECLMSFSNQFDSFQIDRHQIYDLLTDLTGSRSLPFINGRNWQAHLEWLRSLTDSRSELERRFIDALVEGHYRLPDDAQRAIAEPRCIPDFFYEPNICVFCDGSVHDTSDQVQRDREVRTELRNREYRVIVIRYDRSIAEQILHDKDVFER